MSTKSSKTEERIDPRTKRAAVESMAIDDYPGQAGEYDVYSASGSVYRVDVVTGACTCPDYEQRKPANGCKHARRVAMEIGVIEIPDLDRNTDVERMIESRNRLNADQETDPQPVADGGQPDSDDGGLSSRSRTL